MSVSPLRITYFQTDKIRSAGMQQQSAAYRVTTYKGPEIGLLGALPAVLLKLHALNTAEASNSDFYENSTSRLLQKLTRCYRLG